MTVTSLTVVAVGVVLTISPLAHTLGFTALPWQFFAVLGAFVVTYLILVELTKKWFYAEPIRQFGQPRRTRGAEHRIHRRAAGSVSRRPSHHAPDGERRPDHGPPPRV